MAPAGVTRFLYQSMFLCVLSASVTSGMRGPLCSIKNVDEGERKPTCSFAFYMTDCERELSDLEQQQQLQQDGQQQQHVVSHPPFSSFSLASSTSPLPSNSSTGTIRLREKPLNSVNSAVDLIFSLQEEGLTVLRVSGVAVGPGRRSRNRQTSSRSRYITRSSRDTSSSQSSSSYIRNTRRDLRNSQSSRSSYVTSNIKRSIGSNIGSSRRNGSSRRSSRSNERCVLVVVEEGSAGDVVVVKGLPLPHGHYNLTHLVLASPSPFLLSTSTSVLSLTSSSNLTSSVPLSQSFSSQLPSRLSPLTPIPSSHVTSLPPSSSSSSSSSFPSLSTSLSTSAAPSSFPSASSSPSTLSPVAHHSITLPFSKSGKIYEWERGRRRSRREGASHLDTLSLSTRDLVLGNIADYPSREEGDGGGRGDWDGGGCTCCQCYNQTVDYREVTAVLSYTFSLNGSCPAVCSDVNVQLYSDPNIESREDCELHRIHSVLHLYRVGNDKNITKGPLTYYNVDVGCYLFELQPHVYPWPERYGFFWLHPNITVTDMSNWNTTFYLEPNPETRSLRVVWNEVPRYNFTKYILQLWHHPTNLSCRGDSTEYGITVLPRDEKLVVTQTSYKFENLSLGWYCARVTPLDDRCPLDGCSPLSSKARELKELHPLQCNGTTSCDDSWSTGAVAGVAVVGALMVVVTGMVVACCVFRYYPPLATATKAVYTPVPVKNRCDGGKMAPRVLVVWTPQGANGHKFGQVVAAFKTLLHSYAHCQVLDYLDLLTLPDDQRHHLMAYPVAWLDSILLRPDVKIIIIASAGARQRQRESFLPVPSTQHHQPSDTPLPPLDPLMFPYLLRRLQDQPDLAADYSRVFHVRFSDVSDADTELEGIVSWTRYCLPEHLPALACSLHGHRDGSMIPPPTPEQLTDLLHALRSHPDYRPHTSPASSIAPDLLTSNRLSSVPNSLRNHSHFPNGTSHSTHNGQSSFV